MSPLPPTDADRVAAVRNLALLDSNGHVPFDGIVRIVSAALDSSIAMISLMDEQRQWFLASRGLDMKEIPRDIALCNYSVALGEPILLGDARSDNRFVDNPLVRDGPRVRSYLTHPVRSPDGHVLGTICAADPSMNKFDGSHLELMEKLSMLLEHLFAAHALNLEMERMHLDLAAEKKRLEHANLIFRQMERIARIGAWEVDLDSSELRWSDGIYAIYDHPADVPIDGQAARDYFAPEQRQMVMDAILKAIDGGEELALEADIITREERRKHVHLIGERHASEQIPNRMVGVMMDVTERHNAHLALKRAAEIDDLTGLPNRNAFTASLDQAIRRRQDHDGSLYLLIFDLDGLKEANDIYGHVVGDIVLAEISTRLLALTPQGHSLARWGGDEFTVAMHGGMNREAVLEFAEQALEAIARAIELPGKTIYLRATCGIAEHDAPICSKELVRRANQALHHGKTTGLVRVHFYDQSFEERNRVRMDAELEVRAALQADRIFARYQPIVDLGSGEIEGFEALLRVSTVDGMEMTAAQLLPALVDPELSRMVAARMIALVAADFATLAGGGSLPGFVSINATEADLLSGDYPEMLLSTLARFNVPPERITLEVTETMLLVNDLDRVKAVLDRLKAQGISIALDDFGTGFSSLTHLKVFPIDKVKIDRSFVCDITDDRNAQSIVAAVIAMAQRLSIGVVAEGIETESQLAMLREMDCPSGQGFLLSVPRDAARQGFDAAAGRNPKIENHDKGTRLSPR